MSVIAFNYEDVCKISNTLKENQQVKDFVSQLPEYRERIKPSYIKENEGQYIQRLMWYLYLSNQFCYSVQYQDPITSDLYKQKESDEQLNSLLECKSELSGLIYNIYTNDGNAFLMDKWLNPAVKILEFITEKK
tara:strand:- start:386 stop:787 length:402 start_codon:yes stop_codon:yes gene_type:complete